MGYTQPALQVTTWWWEADTAGRWLPFRVWSVCTQALLLRAFIICVFNPVPLCSVHLCWAGRPCVWVSMSVVGKWRVSVCVTQVYGCILSG